MTGFVTDASVRSWGRTQRFVHRIARPSFRDQLPGLFAAARREQLSLLPIGLRRSYGDSGLNDEGGLIDMSGLDRLIAFDPATGLFEAEAGISLGAILAFAVPKGFFLPVVPGTKFVTLGGAVANDVHGKNHHRAGSFGHWVRELELVRTDGSVHQLRPGGGGDDLFAATIGGLGLTGVITRVVLRLERIGSASVVRRDMPFASLSEYFALVREYAGRSAYTVAWLDCRAGARPGRGIFTLADHAEAGTLKIDAGQEQVVPSLMPAVVLNHLSIGAFNALHHALGRARSAPTSGPYGRFFFPLDGISGWNRLYGAHGLLQHQSVVPPDAAEETIGAMLAEVACGREDSFLAVIKSFGPAPSPGLLSFPREGATLALDFCNRGDATLALLDRLDAIVSAAGGRLYPAKDGRASGAVFRQGYPNLDRFAAHLDEGLTSSFWRRVMG